MTLSTAVYAAARRLGAWVAIAAWMMATAAADPGAEGLAERLAAHVGGTLDVVELGTGKRLVRPTLDGVTEKSGNVTALRLRADGATKVTVLNLSGVTRIVAGRETVYEGKATGKSAAQLRGKVAKERYEMDLAASRVRMEANGVSPWPILSADEHAAEVEKLAAFMDEVKEAFPALVKTETHEFLVLTDIPADQMGPYVAKLDAMHDFLCDLYGIPRGEPVWKGKCLVVAFLREDDFLAFEGKFMRAAARAFIKENGSLGPGFFEADNIQAIHYGMASGLVKFLVAKDRRKFARFVRGIKEGQSVDDALRDSFGASLDEVAAAFGQALGVAALKP